jgi:centromeric protein E
MALSPNKQRTLSRQVSQPSLAVGLPPALPESYNMMPSSSSSRSLVNRSRKKHPSRRGDVSSSNATSPEASEDEWSLPITPSSSTSTVDPETTPKRRVVALLDGSKTQPRKRDNLQARLQAAAKLQKSRSQGEGLNDSPSIGHLVPKVKPEVLAKSTSGVINSGSSSNGSKDKVVVCVRYVEMSRR